MFTPDDYQRRVEYTHTHISMYVQTEGGGQNKVRVAWEHQTKQVREKQLYAQCVRLIEDQFYRQQLVAKNCVSVTREQTISGVIGSITRCVQSIGWTAAASTYSDGLVCYRVLTYSSRIKNTLQTALSGCKFVVERSMCAVHNDSWRSSACMDTNCTEYVSGRMQRNVQCQKLCTISRSSNVCVEYCVTAKVLNIQ